MPAQTIDAGATAPVFYPVTETRMTTTFPAPDVLALNIAENMKADWPRLHLREDFGKAKGKPLAILSAGPSLNKFLPEVYEYFTDVMVCGSAHDHVVKYGIDPTYSVQADGSKLALDFFKLRLPGTQYLMASQCDPVMFEGLPRDQVFMWHNINNEIQTGFNAEPAICGGCTVTLRAINIAVLLGYHDLHFYGFDSCFEDVENQHAFEYQEEKDGSNRDAFDVRVGGEGGRVFQCNPTFLTQAREFQEMCGAFSHMFNPTVHGDGLIAEIMKVAARENAA